jgi:hypothetical protein
MDYSGYVVSAVAVAVYLVCAILHSIDKFDNKWLPATAGILGIAFNVWFTRSFDFSVFIGGLASGLSATGFDQMVKKALE